MLGSEEVEAPIPPGRFPEAPLTSLHRMNIVKSTLGSLRILMMAAAASALFGAMPRIALAYLNGLDVYVGDNGRGMPAGELDHGQKQRLHFRICESRPKASMPSMVQFTANMTGANAAGVYVGPYHFAHTESLSPAGTRQVRQLHRGRIRV